MNRSERIVRFPWCLTDAEYALGLSMLQAGQMPRLNGKPNDWEAQLEKFAKYAGAAGAFAAWLAGGPIGQVISSGAKYGGAGFVLTSAAGQGAEWVDRRFLMGLYEADGRRRALAEV